MLKKPEIFPDLYMENNKGVTLFGTFSRFETDFKPFQTLIIMFCDFSSIRKISLGP